MTQISDQQRTAFRDQGYLVVPGALDAGQIAEGRKIVTALLERQPIPDGHAGGHVLWLQFGPDGHRHFSGDIRKQVLETLIPKYLQNRFEAEDLKVVGQVRYHRGAFRGRRTAAL